MAYDLYGKKPTRPEGRHFRRTTSSWPPIVEVCHALASWQGMKCRDWYGRDEGHGLNEKHALKLADKLQGRIDSGELTKLLDKYAGRASGYRVECNEKDIEAFIAFLKACGGFEIM